MLRASATPSRVCQKPVKGFWPRHDYILLGIYLVVIYFVSDALELMLACLLAQHLVNASNVIS